MEGNAIHEWIILLAKNYIAQRHELYIWKYSEKSCLLHAYCNSWARTSVSPRDGCASCAGLCNKTVLDISAGTHHMCGWFELPLCLIIGIWFYWWHVARKHFQLEFQKFCSPGRCGNFSTMLPQPSVPTLDKNAIVSLWKQLQHVACWCFLYWPCV